jgi:peroxiredoxin
MRVFIILCLIAPFAGCADTSRNAQAEQAAAASPAKADKEASAESFGVGDQAPAFNGLAGVDDKQHSLRDYADAKAIVLTFICNHCPVAVSYEDRLMALQKDYAEKGVQLVAINVNNLEVDKLPAMKKRAEEQGFNFPYLYDPSQQVGRDYGAVVTPHIFLLDGERKLAYVGPVDDSQDEAKVTEQYLRDAIDAVLAGNSPEKSEVKPFGCGIRYE